jgi:nucleotide-binding universal stress UspA family protein
MYERIIVAVDGTHTSNLALQEAIKLCKQQRSRLRILHVVDPSVIYISDLEFIGVAQFKQALMDAGERILETSAATATSAGVEPETRLLEVTQLNQRVVDLIITESRAWPADLIVVGTHGRRGISHLFLGSVAEGVVRASPAPVLLIRGR